MSIKGSITASCGHKVASMEDGADVRYGGHDCDAVDGFQPCIFYAFFCRPCAEKLKASGDLIETDEQEDAWFNAN